MPHERRHQVAAGGTVTTVRDRLQDLVRDAATPFPCGYALLIHPRRRLGEHGFGVITLSGESLPLSVPMLVALSQVPALLDGLTPVTLGPAEPLDWTAPAAGSVPLSEVLPVSRLALWHGAPRSPGTSLLGLGNVLSADALGPQLVLLLAARPDGWPA